uniref:Uncharacterized protein n=1 Tax=Knipowitschia caucasica TaxID=637954 RepID=A0AAV2LII4_KNICA
MSLKPRPESQSPGLARYNLAAAVYVQRLPVVSADCSPRAALQRHDGPDAERLKRKQADDYDSDEEDVQMDQVLAQDLEDPWEQKFRNMQFTPRVRGQWKRI